MSGGVPVTLEGEKVNSSLPKRSRRHGADATGQALECEKLMAVVTFSREAHTGTRDLARQVAQRLGYRYVSRDELTSVVTARSGVHRRAQDQETEGRSLSLWEQVSEQLSGTR